MKRRERTALPMRQAERPAIAPPAQLLRIDRVFQPQAAALNALVDMLYLLFVDGSELAGLPTSSEPTCFPVPPE